MNNFIQASATQTEVLCGEKKHQVESRMQSHMHQITVLNISLLTTTT